MHHSSYSLHFSQSANKLENNKPSAIRALRVSSEVGCINDQARFASVPALMLGRRWLKSPEDKFVQ